MVGVDKQNHVAFTNLLSQRRSVLGTRRGVDDDGGDIFRSANAGRDGDLREDRLDLVGDELILDESRDQA
jgi:hypothetical protein